MAVEIFDPRVYRRPSVAKNPPAMYLDADQLRLNKAAADILAPFGDHVLVMIDVDERKIALRPIEFCPPEAKGHERKFTSTSGGAQKQMTVKGLMKRMGLTERTVFTAIWNAEERMLEGIVDDAA